MNKLDMESLNIVNENIDKISELFPNVIVESSEGRKIDFSLLKQELSEIIVDDSKEKYQLTWPGKKEAILNANATTTNTLRPVKDKSLNFNDTNNVYIEGDNLEVLKLLQESYLNKIKCIYIDPPYNTGSDFIYNDNFNKNANEELEASGQVDEYGNRLVSNTQSNGRFHSDWLSMMYSRLKLSRYLLKKDGLIFVSIDDNEIHNLKKIMDELFGEEEFIAQLPRITTIKGKNDEKKVATSHDYVLVYGGGEVNKLAKNKDFRSIERYKLEDERGKYYVEATLDAVSLPYSKALDFDININGKTISPIVYNGKKTCWRWSKELVDFGLKNDLIVEKNGRLYTKTYLNYEVKKVDGKYQIVEKEIGGTFRSLLLLDYKFSNNEASRALKDLKLNFSYSKPVSLIMQLIQLIPNNEDDIYLDFFSGSATTAHAIMQLNAEDGGKRKFIMVQLPEKIDEKNGNQSDSFNTICDLGEERIKRAGELIKKETNADIDYGFRVYKVDSSNMKDVYYKPSEISQMNLLDYISNIKDDRTPEDLLTQVMLDLGLTLDLKIEEKTISSNKVFYVEDNSLVACFDDQIDINIIEEICKCEPMKVVFKDSSFKTDKDKINLEEKIKKLSPDTEVSIL